ncbi:MAG TPA: DUF4091 domain-containing protein [Armatimonadota bacterium]|nr:DUF4091 domain-containing protein [Armatimonadota bacterium]
MQFDCWLSTAMQRWFPRSTPATPKPLRLDAARGEQVSFQVCVRYPRGSGTIPVMVPVLDGDGLDVRIRRVGHVTVPHHNTDTPVRERDGVGHIPGYVPDPLFDDIKSLLAPGEILSYWVTVHVPADAKPGDRKVRVSISVGPKIKRLTATVRVSPVVIEPRQNFPVTHWFYADALCDWYDVDPWSREFWPICKKYFRNFTDHGSDTLLTPLFTPPLDGVKRPTQLLGVARDGDSYTFDWSDVDRWVKLAKQSGVKQFEWSHLFTQWGVKHALRVYDGQGLDEKLLWKPTTGATSPTYRNFLGQLLPELHQFLSRRKLMDKSFFHVSDEPHGAEHLKNYVAARALLGELAPWMKVMDALSGIEYGRQGLTDMPIPSISVTKQYHDEGIPSWTYFCCGPRGAYLNRLHDTPLAKIRASGWLFHRFKCLGFLHWGYNYWYESQTRNMIDPFTVTDGLRWPNWAYGDTCLVYPGPDGPIDSIRGEVFKESLQDMALLQTLGVEPGGKMLSVFQDFDAFPKTQDWYVSARRKLLK